MVPKQAMITDVYFNVIDRYVHLNRPCFSWLIFIDVLYSRISPELKGYCWLGGAWEDGSRHKQQDGRRWQNSVVAGHRGLVDSEW